MSGRFFDEARTGQKGKAGNRVAHMKGMEGVIVKNS